MPVLVPIFLLAFSMVSVTAGAATEEAPAAAQTAEVAPPPPSPEPARRLRVSFGSGVEVRGQQEINPQYMEARMLPQFFLQARYRPFMVSLEGSYERRDTATGPLSVSSQSSQIGVWGRYEFLGSDEFTPFAGAGVGLSFDRVDMSYGDEAAGAGRAS